MSLSTLCLLVLCAVPGRAFMPPNAPSFRSSSSLFMAERRTEKKPQKKELTLKELMQEMERSPEKYIQNDVKKKAKRTRKKVDAPKQEYLYAAQRRAGQTTTSTKRTKEEGEAGNTTATVAAPTVDIYSPVYQARQLGLTNPASQHCDAPMAAVEPEIVARIQVAEDETKASSFAYIIEKPSGWAILGGDKKKKTEDNVAVKEDDANDDETMDDPFDDVPDTMISLQVEEDGTVETIEWDETDMLAAMTPEEIEEFEADGGFDIMRKKPKKQKEVTKKKKSKTASFEGYVRPSVVNWLKETKAEEGTPIRGGKYWTAVAGATGVDDSGLVLLCPKDKVDSLFIDYAKYVAVVGSGKYLAAKPKNLDPVKKDAIEMEVIAKLRRGRGDDVVVTVGLSISEHFSTCNHAVQVCQEQLQDGIRGDPAANPFDRRAPRRLVHCDAIAVSSLTFDDDVAVESDCLPDDIAILADRRNSHAFVDGSFLGRAELFENPYTNAYREIHGAADGFQGWTVDRYDKWLLVQHDDQYPRGPLPSIHDGNTAGVYYLPADPNRSMMGRAEIRPTLLEGVPAPDSVPIQENGVTYLATLDKDLSTGIFLDQRPQRAWLTRNCNEDTRVLNCFAHCGAFTVAAASAGASTVSLDLNKKFLDRIEPQLELNKIDFDDRHDAIFGDCFDWLARLAKRGEEFDIIILDPPSTSIGTKKKRWSVKNDMAELVALAAPMVKKGGLLWTTTNSATIHPIKFANMCKKGLEEVGLKNAKLERVVPMPSDFLSVGPQPVKNLVWRIP